jgi:hypothetical protein
MKMWGDITGSDMGSVSSFDISDIESSVSYIVTLDTSFFDT